MCRLWGFGPAYFQAIAAIRLAWHETTAQTSESSAGAGLGLSDAHGERGVVKVRRTTATARWSGCLWLREVPTPFRGCQVPVARIDEVVNEQLVKKVQEQVQQRKVRLVWP
eukprot:COSAG01_NODE_8783_length_2661_cov_1.881343_3_plen_111_part_00